MLRGGRRGDLALALRMLGVHGEGDGNGVAEAVGGRQGLDALGSGNGELTVHQLHGLAVEGHALQIRVGDGDLCRQAVGAAVRDALHRRSRLVDELRAHLGAGIRQAAAVVALSRLRAVVVIGGVVVVDIVGEAVTQSRLIEILRTSVGLALVQLAVGISEVAAAIRAIPVGGVAVLRAGGGVACRAPGIGVVGSRNDGIGDGLGSPCVSEQLVAVAALPVLQTARLGAGGGGSVVVGQVMMVGIRGAIGSAADAAGGLLGAGGSASWLPRESFTWQPGTAQDRQCWVSSCCQSPHWWLPVW